jgi:uncharacterized membrane protein
VAQHNPNSRLEAFCDGVFAIAITLLVLDIRVPPSALITTTSELWLALARLAPSLFAFLLSFCIIFITWANHHAMLALLDGTSSRFIYANGFLLLTVVLIPFTAALLGEYLFSDHASPAVVLYTAVDALQAVAWIALSQAALTPQALTSSEISIATIRNTRKNGFFAFAIYGACAILALWFPLAVALIITATWVFWLVFGIRTRASLAA